MQQFKKHRIALATLSALLIAPVYANGQKAATEANTQFIVVYKNNAPLFAEVGLTEQLQNAQALTADGLPDSLSNQLQPLVQQHVSEDLSA